MREAFVRTLMASRCGPALQAAGPHLRQGRSQPGRFLRQREGRDNENNAWALGSIPLVRGGPTGHRAWASGHSLPPYGTPRHLTGPISRRRLPGMSPLPGSAWALPTTHTSCDGQLGDRPDLGMNPSSAP